MTMTMSTDVTVKLDDRVRLISAVLALTSFPDTVQAKRPHGTHIHARMTRKNLAEHSQHPAVLDLEMLLAKGAPLEAIYTLALLVRLDEGKLTTKAPAWLPPDWAAHLVDFYQTSGVIAWWQNDADSWMRATEEATQMFGAVQFKPFLSKFLGDFPERLTFIPNISYPTERELALKFGGEYICIVPPRIAWGESPPWPFNEDPAHIYRALLASTGHMMMLNFLREHESEISLEGKKPLPLTDQFMSMNPTWAEQFTYLFVASAVAMFLEDHYNRKEADAFILMERRVTGLEVLPAAITVYRRYLREVEEGNYKNILDAIPTFSRQLRVAHRMIKL